MPVKYILDTRERKLQDIFAANSIPFTTKQLDLGDILILYSKGEIVNNMEQENKAANKLLRTEPVLKSEHETHTIVIERKSFTDLKASMADKRYHEQKARYMALPRGTMYYIFENNDKNFKELGRKQYIGAYIHTAIRDSLAVFVTSSMEETFEFIVKIGETFERFGFNASEKSTPVSATQIKKKKAVGAEVYKQQLCCIPGISSGKADSIVSVYKNMTDLITAVKNDTFKIKGIGRVLLSKIKESLLLDGKTETSNEANLSFD